MLIVFAVFCVVLVLILRGLDALSNEDSVSHTMVSLYCCMYEQVFFYSLHAYSTCTLYNHFNYVCSMGKRKDVLKNNGRL